MTTKEQWKNVIGRVAFLNCDPLFHGLDEQWDVLPARGFLSLGVEVKRLSSRSSSKEIFWIIRYYCGFE